ncbi:MAG: hypothetical protein ABSE39_13220 [Candidatus Bathyarchaeia archaeon]
MNMPQLFSKDKITKWVAIVLIVVTSWAINLTLSLGAIQYTCQPHPRTPTCDLVTAVALAWLIFQHYLVILFAGFVVGRITNTRILR